METFLELIREILKGAVREITAHLFRGEVLPALLLFIIFKVGLTPFSSMLSLF